MSNPSPADSSLWTPSADRVSRSRLEAFRKLVAKRHGVVSADYAELHRWSVAQMEDFWRSVWEFSGVIA